MNCVLNRFHVAGDLFVPEGVPVRVVRTRFFEDKGKVVCIASIAIRGEEFVGDVEIEVEPGMLLFMSVDPEEIR